MYLKNYTSEVPVDTTLARIERLLVTVGATGFAKTYEGQQCKAVIFEICFDPKVPSVKVKMPANVQNCLEALWNDYVKGSPNGRKTKEDFRAQAARTAWKLIQDWIEVQVSLIQLRQAEFLQVFLPYVWDGQSTVYERVKGSGYAALLPERTGE